MLQPDVSVTRDLSVLPSEPRGARHRASLMIAQEGAALPMFPLLPLSSARSGNSGKALLVLTRLRD